MEDWSATTIETINEKLKDTRPVDLRFFRVDEFKRNVERVGEYAGKCPVCTREQINIRNITGKIDEAIGAPGKSRREYDKLISRLAAHMQNEHGFFTPNHYTYRYSFYGIVVGAAAGFLAMMLFTENNMAFLSTGFSLGLLIGYIYGGGKDRKIREKKKLM